MSISDFWSLLRLCASAVLIVCTVHIAAFVLRYAIDEIAHIARRARK